MAGDILLDGREWNRSFTLSLKKMQEAGLLCDTAIICSGADSDPILAHSCVLAASSPFLKDILLKQATDSTVAETGIKQVDSMGYGDVIWRFLLEFMYKSRVMIPAEHRHYLQEIEEAAMSLSVKGLIDAVTLAQTKGDDAHEQLSAEDTAEESVDLEEIIVEKVKSPLKKLSPKQTRQRLEKIHQHQEVEETPSKRSSRIALKKPRVDQDKTGSKKTVQLKKEKDVGDKRTRAARKRKRFSDAEDSDDSDLNPDYVEKKASKQREHACEICDGVFPARRPLQRHMKLFHPELKNFFCTLCSKPFNCRVFLQDHNRKEHNAKLLECIICYKEFVTKDAWRRHMRLFHPEVNVKQAFANILDTSTMEEVDQSTVQSLLEVTAPGTQERTQTDEEERSITVTVGGNVRLKKPINVNDEEEEEPETSVVIDSKHESAEEDIMDPAPDDNTEEDLVELTETVTMEEASNAIPEFWQCSLCGYSCTSKVILEKHAEIHNTKDVTMEEASNAIPEFWQCSQCGYSCKSKVILEKHTKKVHNTKEILKCTECPKEFHSVQGLSNHQQLRHPDKYEGSHMCTDCGRSFSQQGRLEDHARLKHNAPLLQCSMCNKEFRTRDSIYRHERFKHYLLGRRAMNQSRFFECRDCAEKFKKLSMLEDHMRKEHNAPPLVCEHCGMDFIGKDQLYRHNRQYHSARNADGGNPMTVLTPEDYAKEQEAVEWRKQNSKFKCDQCEYAAASSFTLQEHMKKHFNVKLYKCPTCGKDFKYKVGMYNHQARHHPETVTGNFNCELCKEIFGRRIHLDDHLRIKHDAPPLSCEFCNKTYRTKDALYRHGRFEHPGLVKKRMKTLHKCDQCNYVNISKAAYQVHMMTHSDVRAFTCEICGMTFKYKGDLTKHNRAQHMPDYVPQIYPCDICGYECKNKQMLQRHYISRHKREFQRSFPCEICNQEFGSKTNRNDHVRIEHNGHLIQCQFCSMGFTDPNEWYDHRQMEHPDLASRVAGNPELYVCGICNKEFTKIALLRRHERYHVTIRPFKCDVCSSTFVAKEDLATHSKVHSGNKPFSCPHCSFKTLRKPTLRMHMRKHTSQALQCHQCDRRYIAPLSLQNHLVANHRMDKLEAKELVLQQREQLGEVDIIEEQQIESEQSIMVAVSGESSNNFLQLHDVAAADMDLSHVIHQANLVIKENPQQQQQVVIKQEPQQHQQLHHQQQEQPYMHVPDVGDTTIIQEVALKAEEDGGIEAEEEQENVVYIMADDSANTGDVIRTEEGGQQVMYIKLSDNQYVQVMDPETMVQMA